MNLLRTIIERLNQRIEVANIFDKQFGLCELNANGNEKAWVHYIGNGQAEVVTNFDAKQGTLFWAKRGKVTVAKTDAYKMSGCKQLYVTSFPLTAYAVVRKSHLPCDGDDAQDWLASRIYKITSGTDPLFKQSIGVINYEVIPSGYINEIKTLTANYEWACVTVDFDIQVITTTEDGCYDICATGDIPLPDLQPCTPCLTEVAVDGVTIIGNGTADDPLVAVGGEGGAISVEEEGVEVTPIATTLNFVGEGVTASLTSPGVVEVNVPGGGGAVGTLQEVTDLGNSTTNDIDFIANAGLSFDNGAFIRKGTTDAGNGGAKGTSQICSISYELKWEAGRLYYMQQDGFTIRDVTHNFTFVPQVTDDSSKGFVVGSRWILDDGTVYLCSDDTIGAAVWAVVATSVSNLQDVTDIGNTTTNDLIVQGSNDFIGQVSSQTISAYNSVTGAYAEMFVDTKGQLTLSDGISAGILSVNNLSNANVQLEFPNKVTGNYTIATTADIPSTIVTDVTGTAPIASSGGTTPDISITQADGTTDGYLSSTDWNTFDGKFDVPTGTSSDYLDGTGAPTAFPTIPTLTSELTNDSGFITIGDVPTQVNSDWNATTGVEEILNKPSIPAAQIQSDWNQSNNVALDFIKNKPTIPTNGLPSGGTAGQILTKVDATDYNATWQENYADWTSVVKHIVKNNGASGTITKGTAVYVTGSNGTNMLVGRASNTSEATSSKTMGLMQSDITTTGGTQTGFVITEGLIANLNTAGTTAGDPVWLGVNGALIYGLINKPYAPAHLVFIGIVTKVSAGSGEIFVKVQNGFELKEIHDVDLITTTPINGHVLGFDGTLWVNKTIATWLGFTPVTDARTISTTAPLSGGGDLTANRTLSIADAAADGTTKGAATFTASDFNATSGVISIDYTNGQAASGSTKGFLTSANWTTFNGKQDALTSGTNIKTINSASILGSGNIATPFELVVAASDETTALTTGTAKITFRMPRAITLTSVRASLTTAQASGSILTIDINESGTSILSTKLTIDNTETTSTSAATPPVISDVNLADDSEITIDIDQIGNGTAKGLKVMLIGNYV
jgi:hypothetical protein